MTSFAIRRVQIFDEDVLEVGAGDRQAPRERVVVADAHADERRLRGADRVPAWRVQMDDVAQRRIGDRAVRIVRDDRLAGRRHRAADDPVVAAGVRHGVDRHRRDCVCFGAQLHGSARAICGRGSSPAGSSGRDDVFGDERDVEPFGTVRSSHGSGAARRFASFTPYLRDVHRQPQLVDGVAERRLAQDHGLRGPRQRLDAGQREFDRQASACDVMYALMPLA